MAVNRRIFASAIVASLGVVLVGTAEAQQHVNGIDVSAYQGNVNWTSVHNAGYSLGFAKATEGANITDSYFAQNWAGMKAAGMIRGAYHYGHPGTDASTQAQYFVNAVKAAGGYSGSNSLQLALDIETTDGTTASHTWAWIENFVAEVKALTGRPAIIYCSPSFWEDTLGNPTNNLNCPLWIANYGVSSPEVPAAWSTWSFWQYSDSGSVSGVSGAVDLDYFNGTITQLKQLCFP